MTIHPVKRRACASCTRDEADHPLPHCAVFVPPRGRGRARLGTLAPPPGRLADVREKLVEALAIVDAIIGPKHAAKTPKPAPPPTNGMQPTQPPLRRPRTIDVRVPADMSQGEHRILTATYQTLLGASPPYLIVTTGYKRRSIEKYVSLLRAKRLVSAGWPLIITPDGRDALGSSVEPLPTGRALYDYWMHELGEGEARLLEVYVRAHPGALNNARVRELTGYAERSVEKYVSKLTSRSLLEKTGRGERRASGHLFG